MRKRNSMLPPGVRTYMRRPFLCLFTTVTVAGCLAFTVFAQDSTPQGAQDSAQQNAPGSDVAPIIRSRVDVVVAPTTVLDRGGSYVTGIRPAQFRLYDNDKIQDIRVDETFAPISLVVAIQQNSKVENVIPTLKKIGPIFSNLVAGEGGEIALIGFDGRVQLLQDFTSDTNNIETALQKLRPGSSSSRMIDATVEAARMLSHRPRDRRRILLLITESRDIASEAKPKEALTSLEMANVQVYSVNISRLRSEMTAKTPAPRPDPIPVTARPVIVPGMPQTPTSMAQLGGMQGQNVQFAPMISEIFRATKAIFVDNPVEVFTKYTGGKEHGFFNQKDLERAMADIGREVHNQYMLTYNPSNKDDGGFHNIRVEVEGYNVRTRPGYWMAAIR